MTARRKDDEMDQNEQRAGGLESEAQELARQVEILRKDLVELGNTVRALAQEGSVAAQRGVREATDTLARKGHDLADDVKTAGQQAVDYSSEMFKEKYGEFESAVRKHPTTAVAVALGLGYLAGLLSRNRRS